MKLFIVVAKGRNENKDFDLAWCDCKSVAKDLIDYYNLLYSDYYEYYIREENLTSSYEGIHKLAVEYLDKAIKGEV